VKGQVKKENSAAGMKHFALTDFHDNTEEVGKRATLMANNVILIKN